MLGVEQKYMHDLGIQFHLHMHARTHTHTHTDTDKHFLFGSSIKVQAMP